jgi:translocation and assembly module TamB
MREVHGWRRVLRWTEGVLGVLVGLIVIAVVVVAVGMQTARGREFVRAQVESKLADAFVGGATIGAIDGTPFTELVLRDVVINGPDRRPSVKVGALHVHVGVLPLITHQLVVDKLEVDDADVIVDDRLAHIQKPGPKSTWNVWLPDAVIHRAHVKYDTYDLDALELTASVRVVPDGPLDATAQLSAKWRQNDAAIDLGASVHVGQDETRVPSAIVRVADIVVTANAVRIPKQSSRYQGAVVASVPAATVAQLRPDVKPPLDVALAAVAVPAGAQTEVTLDGDLGGAPLHAHATGDPRDQSAAGSFELRDLDLFATTHGQTDGLGSVRATFDITHGDGHVDATVTTSGAVRSTIEVAVTKRGKAIALDRAVAVAKTRDPVRSTGGKAPVRGALDLDLHASGALAPKPDLAIAGHVEGRQLRVQDFYAASLAMQVDATHVPSQPIGHGRIELVDLARGEMQLGKLTIAAGNRPDKKLQVSVRSVPKQAPWLIDLDLLVTPGETVGIDLQRHFVRAAGGATWTGTSGHLTVAPDKIALRDFKSESRDGNLALAASYVRAGAAAGDLSAQLDGSIDLSNMQTSVKGKASAWVDVERRGRRWSGSVAVDAKGLQRHDIAFDANAKIAARGGRVTAEISTTSARAGAAKITADVAAPSDLANVRAWRVLTRRAIDRLAIRIDRADLATLAKLFGASPMQGTIDGDIEIVNGDAKGTLRARGVRGDEIRDLGALGADVQIEQRTHDTIDATATASIQAFAGLAFAARFAVPDRVFDPSSWKRLGIGALRSAEIKTSAIAFEPGTLQKLGIVSNLRGVASAQAKLGPGLDRAEVALDIRDLHGGPFAMPVAGRVEATADQRDTRVTIGLRARGLEIVRAHIDAPVSLDALRADPKAARATQLHGLVEFPNIDAKRLAAVLGNTQVASGTLDGKIEVAGTLARPTAVAKLTARNVTTPPDEGGRKVPVVDEMTLDGTWDGFAAKVAIAGRESNGGTLQITASAQPSALRDGNATMVATALDLAPIVAFLPGPAGGIGGRLDANLAVHGLDPHVAQLAGSLHVTEGRLPIAPAVGTLFHGDLQVKIANNAAAITAAGKLGNGDVRLSGTAPLLSPDAPPSGQIELTMRKVQLIGTTEPVIDGTVSAKIQRTNDAWHFDVHVSRAAVRVPADKGEKLAPVGPPNDLVYGGKQHYHPPDQVRGSPPHRAAPENPILVADIRIDATKVETNELRGDVQGRLKVTVGDKELGIVGNIGLLRGDLDLFDRRYQVERAAIHFDGSTDPVLDVRITHDFPDVTTVTEIHGRASKPELTMSSNPGLYSQAELLGFLLGGEPGGDPNNAPSTQQRVAAAGESFVANQLGGYVKKALPIDIDVLRYESATATSSAAVTVGTWLTHELFLAYRQHLESRPDENAGEGEIEYWLRRRLVIEATVGDRGYNGADLLWRRRW